MSQRPTESTKQFFDQWQLYQQIIERNYMAHQGIHQVIQQLIQQQFITPFQFLDLGCGDAQAIAATLAHSQIASYTGVDLSPNALQLAAKNLTAIGKTELICDDFLSYLQSQLNTRQFQFDIIHFGFSLHHLLLPEKQQAFQYCYTLLKPSGYLLIYDVFRQPDQSRDDYIQAYLTVANRDWTGLSSQQIQAIADHIQECDFPESLTKLSVIAQAAGFLPPSSLFADASGFHQLLAFRLPEMKRD
jgi:ubiquinone/menaquinone biosynthesis C-methylase UbiE